MVAGSDAYTENSGFDGVSYEEGRHPLREKGQKPEPGLFLCFGPVGAFNHLILLHLSEDVRVIIQAVQKVEDKPAVSIEVLPRGYQQTLKISITAFPGVIPHTKMLIKVVLHIGKFRIVFSGKKISGFLEQNIRHRMALVILLVNPLTEPKGLGYHRVPSHNSRNPLSRITFRDYILEIRVQLLCFISKSGLQRRICFVRRF